MTSIQPSSSTSQLVEPHGENELPAISTVSSAVLRAGANVRSLDLALVARTPHAPDPAFLQSAPFNRAIDLVTEARNRLREAQIQLQVVMGIPTASRFPELSAHDVAWENIQASRRAWVEAQAKRPKLISTPQGILKASVRFGPKSFGRLSSSEWPSAVAGATVHRSRDNATILSLAHITSTMLEQLWNEKPQHETYESFVQKISNFDPTKEQWEKFQWRDHDGTLRTEVPFLGKKLALMQRIKYEEVLDETGSTMTSKESSVINHYQNLSSVVMLALKLNSQGDFVNFARVVAVVPDILIPELIGGKVAAGMIFEEVSIGIILNQLVSRQARDERKFSHLSDLACSAFTHFLEHYPGKWKERPYFLRVMHPNDIHQYALANDSENFLEVMTTALAPEDLGNSGLNLVAASLRIAIIYAAGTKYAAKVKAHQQEEIDRFSLLLGVVFGSAKSLIVAGGSAAPAGGSVAGTAAGDAILSVKDLITYVINHKESLKPADLAPKVARHLRRTITNLSMRGIRVPCMADKDLTAATSKVERIEANIRKREGSEFVAQLVEQFSALVGADIALIQAVHDTGIYMDPNRDAAKTEDLGV